MAAAEDLKKKFEELFQKAKESLPEVQSWNKVYQIVLEDGGEFYIEISGGELKIADGRHPSPIATLTLTSDTLKEILDGQTDAMKAFMMRKLKITGNVLDTMNLKRIIDAGLGRL
ncbi:SCP2 sterol-binding domain-containing protein [Aeropyrum camini]|uniref:Putative sterol carrier protein n=1 Tax=Aeropyrum camini SY1 = JCM 12091 TaxID=1198449 RepID=U3TBT0_9CREN|nr:SCP2 sterol-binding domain-containing protein [Aeropyrum camini]BAN90997.1 putative sterol carrier protein [Aeropyrum camini SY1 = JCM 12091]